MYIEPTWIDLLLHGTLVKLVFIIISILITYTTIKIIEHYWEDLKAEPWVKIGIGLIICLIILIPMSVVADYTWNQLYEQPSVRSETVTIADIQPLPGAVEMTENGYYIDNSNQLMFITTNGKEFANTENWMFNKFETRTIFNQLKVNGTYKIKYYGWRNGHSNEFPNILSVQVINENGTQPNDYNKYFGANRGNRAYDLDEFIE